MANLVNQTLLPKDGNYPERLVLEDKWTDWELEVPAYIDAPTYKEPALTRRLLAAKGVQVATDDDLRRLGTLSDRQAFEAYGEKILDLRNPLGRTGINGAGAYYEAGASQTADLAIVNPFSTEPTIGLVFNRGKWHLPGGFIEPQDEGDLRRTALREGCEETTLDFQHLYASAKVKTLVERSVKPRSSRSADFGFIYNQVEMVWLTDPLDSVRLRARDDAELASWHDIDDLFVLRESKLISADHFDYALLALSS